MSDQPQFQELIKKIIQRADYRDPADALIVSMPAIVKAHTDSSGRRLIEVDASCEDRDSEGDVIEQKALLDSADTFIKNGHIDIDHISELGARYGIPNPESYVIGRPREVKDYGGGHTGVMWECMRAPDGHDAKKNRFDMFWDSLQTEPPMRWQASIYGFPMPDAVVDCRDKGSCESGATRFHIKALDWRSLAMTRTPVQTNLHGYAKVVSAKSWLGALVKSGAITQPPNIPSADMRPGANGYPYDAPTIAQTEPQLPPIAALSPVFPLSASDPNIPRNMADLVGQWHTHISRDCPHSQGLSTTLGFKAHFENCCGIPSHVSDILAHALMHKLYLDRRRALREEALRH